MVRRARARQEVGADAATDPQATSQNVTFRPSPWMYGLAHAIAGHLTDNRPVPSRTVLAQECKVARETVSRAYARPGFCDWLSQHIAALVGDVKLHDCIIRSRVAGQAGSGSVKHQRLWFELRGELGRGGGGEGAGLGKLGHGWVVTIGVPRTPAPDLATSPPASIDAAPLAKKLDPRKA